MVGDAVDLSRRAQQVAPRLPDRQNRVGAGVQKGAQVRRLFLVRRGDVDLGREALVEPAGEGGPETAHHGPDAQIGGQGEHQRHEGQRQARQLLTRVGEEPVRRRAGDDALKAREDERQGRRQKQRRAQQEPAQKQEAGDDPVGERGRDEPGADQSGAGERLQAQPGCGGAGPGARPGAGEQAHGGGAAHRLGGGGERADHRDRQAGEDPAGPHGEGAAHVRAVEAAQRGGHVGQERAGDAVAQCDAGEPGGERQHQRFNHQRGDHRRQGRAERTQGAKAGAALLEGQTDGGVDDEEAHREGEKAEGGQIEMEAVGEASDVAPAAGACQIRRDSIQRPQALARWIDEDRAHAPVHPQEALGRGDVCQERARLQLRADRDGRQVLDSAQPFCGFRRGQQDARRREEGETRTVAALGFVGAESAAGRGERIDPGERIHGAAGLQLALDQRGGGPSGAAQ